MPDLFSLEPGAVDQGHKEAPGVRQPAQVHDDRERHACEVRHWADVFEAKGATHMTEVMLDIEKRRGKPAADRLRQDVWSLLRARRKG